MELSLRLMIHSLFVMLIESYQSRREFHTREKHRGLAKDRRRPYDGDALESNRSMDFYWSLLVS